MRVILKTYVEESPEKVFEGFTRELFIKLKPPGVGLKLLQFDGCQKGSVVALELNFGLFKQRWTSLVTEFGKSEDEIFFVDESEGKDLPFFLKKWKHRHRLVKEGNGTFIIDEIDYQSPFGMNLLMYPALWMQFAWRKPIYRKSFRRKREKQRV